MGHRRRRGTGCGDAVQVDDLDQVGGISVDNHQLATELAPGDQDGQVGGEVGVVDSPARQRQCPDEGQGRRVASLTTMAWSRSAMTRAYLPSG